MLLTIAAAIIAIYFWPLTLIILYFMYWQATIPLTILAGIIWFVYQVFQAIFSPSKGK